MSLQWSAGLLAVGLTGLPHPERLHRYAMSLKNAMSDMTGAEEVPLDDFGNSTTMSPEAANAAMGVFAAAAAIILIFIVIILAWFLGQVLFACAYKGSVFDVRMTRTFTPTAHMTQKSQFTYNLFECTANMNEACCAMCCPGVKFADSHGAVEGGYWGAMCKFIGVNMLITALTNLVVQQIFPDQTTAPTAANPHAAHQSNPADNVSTIVESIFRGLFFGIMMRKALRAKLGDKEPSKGALNDFLAWGFCSCCALTQDTVEMDIAFNMCVGFPCTVIPEKINVKQITSGREVAPGDYEKMLGDSVEEGGR